MPFNSPDRESKESLATLQRKWNAKILELKRPDRYGYVIENEVLETCAALQLLGINTVQSDDGKHSNSPWIEIGAPHSSDVYVGERKRKAELLGKRGMSLEKIDRNSRSFSREVEVNTEGDVRDEMIHEAMERGGNLEFTAEFNEWTERTLVMAEMLRSIIREFYTSEPIPRDFEDIRIGVIFPYRDVQYDPWAVNIPVLQLISAEGDALELESDVKHEEMLTHTRSEWRRFTAFLKKRYFQGK